MANDNLDLARILVAVSFAVTWFPAIVAMGYVFMHRAHIPRKVQFVALSTLLAWGVGSAPGFLIAPLRVWVDHALPALHDSYSATTMLSLIISEPVTLLVDFDLPIGLGLIAAASLWAPGFLRKRLALSSSNPAVR